jgi:hypothetical protein
MTEPAAFKGTHTIRVWDNSGTYHEYAKLLRRIGLGEAWASTRQRVDEGNPYVMRYVNYFDRFGRHLSGTEDRT